MLNIKFILVLLVLLLIIPTGLATSITIPIEKFNFFKSIRGFYLVDTYCYSQAQAQAVANAEIKYRGYCAKGCYAYDTSNVCKGATPEAMANCKRNYECTSDRPYQAKCDDTYNSAQQGSCGADNLVNQCDDNLDCGSGKVCIRTNTGRQCLDAKTYYSCLTAYKYDDTEKRCIRIGCQDDSSCRAGIETCVPNTDKTAFECKLTGQFYVFENKQCVLKDVSQISTSKYYSSLMTCQSGNGINNPLPLSSVKFSSLEYPNKVIPNKEFTIKGFFQPSNSGTYVLSADLDLQSKQPLAIIGTAGSGCSKTQYSSGGQQYASAGLPVQFKLTMVAPEEVGIYTINLIAGENCQNPLGTQSFQVQVGEPVAKTEPPNIINPVDGTTVADGGICTNDYSIICDDNSELVVYKCETGKYIPTDNTCSNDSIDDHVDDTGRKSVIEEGLSGTTYAVVIAVILIIVGLIWYFGFRKKRK